MKNQKEKQEEWLQTIEETHKKILREDEERNKAREICRERREKLRREEKERQEEILKDKYEKEEKKIKKKMLEERWEVARTTATYIDENIDRWSREEEDSERRDKEIIKEWEKLTKVEKIMRVKDNEKIMKRLAGYPPPHTPSNPPETQDDVQPSPSTHTPKQTMIDEQKSEQPTYVQPGTQPLV